VNIGDLVGTKPTQEETHILSSYKEDLKGDGYNEDGYN
jgi:hypothetical protein